VSSWRPLLDGALAERARDVVLTILASTRAGAAADPSIGAGAAGRAILEQYAARAGLSDAARIEARLDEAIAGVEREALDASLFSGFTGVGWAAEHVRGAEDPGANDEIDDALGEHVARTPWRGHYDLVSGLVGIGVFARERRLAGARASCAAAVLDRLEELARRTRDGVAWWTREELIPRAQAVPGGYFDVGVAHGTAGVTAWLGAMSRAGLERERIAPLLEGAVRWLLARRVPGAPAELPLWIGDGAEPPRRAPVGWCYGAPGVAVAILHASLGADEPAWRREALTLARAAAAAEESDVRDAGLCHGRAGLAHILHRVARATGDDELATRARTWFERTLALPPPDDPSLVTGSVGVALALLAAIGEVEPAWDRLLLVS